MPGLRPRIGENHVLHNRRRHGRVVSHHQLPQWSVRMAKGRRRWGVAAVAGLATAALYAAGVLRNGWIEVFLLAPILWYLVAPESGAALENLLLSLAALCLTIAATDLILRPMLGVRLHATPMNAFTRKLPRLPSVARWDPH